MVYHELPMGTGDFNSTRCRHHRLGRCAAFTLIELLIVVTILAVLISILLPSLARARTQVRRVACASNLSQIGTGWQSYLNSHNGAFLRLTIADGGQNAHLIYGGKRSVYEPRPSPDPPFYTRPLNHEMQLPSGGATEGMDVFRCPSDLHGGKPALEVATTHFDEWGTSYAMNWLLVGQFCPANLAGPLKERLCPKLPSLEFEQRTRRPHPNVVRVDHVFQPSHVLLGGDAGWRFVWSPRGDSRLDWHGDADGHNLLFVDGHADYIRMTPRRGFTKDYTMYPFEDVVALFEGR